MRKRGALGALLVTSFAALALAVTAAAYMTTRDYAARPYAAGFPTSAVDRWGPIGIAFDRRDDLYVADTADGNIYRFPPDGGAVSRSTRLTRDPVPGEITGLDFDGAGQLYLARYRPGDVVQLDPRSAQVLRTVAHLPGATGLAVDPVSGSLFVSEDQCGATIWRISHYRHGRASVTPYATAPGVDGLAFDRGGQLYAESDGDVIRIDGTRSSTPGAVSDLAHVPHGDGLAVADSGPGAPYLVVNRNDGIVTHVDFGTLPATLTNIFTGGSRGDLAAVDSHGCLYITQTAEVLRLTARHQRCAFEPSTNWRH